MIVKSTDDVPIAILRELSRELEPDIKVSVDDRQIGLRSVDPPSWITFLAETDWWLKALAAYSAIYIAELVKEGAKETWKNRSKISSGLKTAGNKIWKLSSEIARLKSRMAKRTKLQIGTPEQNQFSCSLEFFGSDAEMLAVQIALFIHHLPAVRDIFSTETQSEKRILGSVLLILLDDSSLEVSWIDAKTFFRERRILPLVETGGGQ